jgi:hypothetical protein
MSIYYANIYENIDTKTGPIQDFYGEFREASR